MDCRTFALLLDTPEEKWTQAQREEMEAHAATCADCRALLTLRREMRAMDAEEAVPADFAASWRKAIRTEEDKNMQRKIIPMHWRRYLAAAAAVVLVAVGTIATYQNQYGGAQKSAGSGSVAAYSTADDGMAYTLGASNAKVAAPSLMAMESATEYDLEEEAAADAGMAAKIIRSANLTIRTQRYEQDYEAIRQLVAEQGGRIESLSVSGDGTSGSLRRASFTLRVPSASLDDFLSGAKGIGSISAYSESSEDVSESYYDTQTRLETQQAKLRRMTEMMQQAESMSDLIELESAITDAQYWIDYYTGQLRRYDSRVDESYVYVTLREISSAAAAEEKTLTLGERIGSAVTGSLEIAGEVLQSALIFLIAALPWLLALAVLILLIRVIVRRVRKKKIKE